MKQIFQLILTLAITTVTGSSCFGGEGSMSFSQARKVMPSLTEIMTLIWGDEGQSMKIYSTGSAIFSVKYADSDQAFEIDPTIYQVSPFLFKKMAESMGPGSLKVSTIRNNDGILEFLDKNGLLISSENLAPLSEEAESVCQRTS